jgi:hypothetical protein
MRKARIWRAFLIKERIFSKKKNAWLGREPPNGEMSAIPPSGRFGGPLADVTTSDRDVRLNQRLG